MRRDALLAVVFAAAFAALTAALAAGGPLVDLDLAVRDWSDAHRPGPVEAVGRVLNRLGQGGALLGICAAGAGWVTLARWRRAQGWWRSVQPPLYVLAAFALVYPLVRIGKELTARGAPSSPWAPEQSVELLGPQPPGLYDAGYPSGHAVNTIVWYGVLLVLVTALARGYGRPDPPRWSWWTVRVVPPVVVCLTQTYLSFHWLTDSLAGLCLGLAIDRVLALLRRSALPSLAVPSLAVPSPAARSRAGRNSG